MLSQETLERYRKMTPGERLELTFQMMRENTPYLFQGSEELIDRRFELLQRENDARNRNMAEVFGRLRKEK
jgi:hypothetical protein